MNKRLIIIMLFLFSCEDKYTTINTQVVRGVISAKDEGHTGRITTLPKFYVQSPKEILTIDVPFSDENLFHIGDTICVVVKTVKSNIDE